MSLTGLLGWFMGLGLVTLIGSLSARKYRRPTHLTGLACAIAAAAQLSHHHLLRPDLGPIVVLAAGGLPLPLCWVLLCATVEKFGQAAGHRTALFATVGQIAAAVTAAWIASIPPGVEGAVLAPIPVWTVLASLMGFLAGANLCVVLYHMTRVFTSERHPWARAAIAVFGAGVVETLVYVPLGFSGRESVGPLVASRLAYAAVSSVPAVFLVLLHRAAQGRRVVE